MPKIHPPPERFGPRMSLLSRSQATAALALGVLATGTLATSTSGPMQLFFFALSMFLTLFLMVSAI